MSILYYQNKGETNTRDLEEAERQLTQHYLGNRLRALFYIGEYELARETLRRLAFRLPFNYLSKNLLQIY